MGEALKAAKNFAAGETDKLGLTLSGPVGLGKSTLLTCIDKFGARGRPEHNNRPSARFPVS